MVYSVLKENIDFKYFSILAGVWYRVFIKYCVFFKYSGLWPLSVSPRCQFVDTMAGQTAELAEFRKITTFQGKNTIFNEHPVPLPFLITPKKRGAFVESGHKTVTNV